MTLVQANVASRLNDSRPMSLIVVAATGGIAATPDTRSDRVQWPTGLVFGAASIAASDGRRVCRWPARRLAMCDAVGTSLQVIAMKALADLAGGALHTHIAAPTAARSPGWQ